jgi:magnesium-transporting ATPase (P-type)
MIDPQRLARPRRPAHHRAGRRHRAGRLRGARGRRPRAGRPAAGAGAQSAHRRGDPHRRIRRGREGDRSGGRRGPAGRPFSAAFSGTFVAAGHGAGVVVATGADTELGRISTLIGSVEQLKTPLIRQMDRFANLLTFVILAISAAVFAFAWALRGYALPDAFMIVVGLAVAAIPEGLPAVITITLAIGVQRMAARKAIIRRLPAVEALGSVSVICSDKTGTLTRNEMMARTVLGAGTASRSRARATPRAAASPPTAPRSSPARPGPCASSSAAPRCATTPNCARRRNLDRRRRSDGRRARLARPEGGRRPRAQDRAPAHRRDPLRRRAPLHGHAAPQP